MESGSNQPVVLLAQNVKADCGGLRGNRQADEIDPWWSSTHNARPIKSALGGQSVNSKWIFFESRDSVVHSGK